MLSKVSLKPCLSAACKRAKLGADIHSLACSLSPCLLPHLKCPPTAASTSLSEQALPVPASLPCSSVRVPPWQTSARWTSWERPTASERLKLGIVNFVHLAACPRAHGRHWHAAAAAASPGGVVVRWPQLVHSTFLLTISNPLFCASQVPGPQHARGQRRLPRSAAQRRKRELCCMLLPAPRLRWIGSCCRAGSRKGVVQNCMLQAAAVHSADVCARCCLGSCRCTASLSSSPLLGRAARHPLNHHYRQRPIDSPSGESPAPQDRALSPNAAL